MENESLCGFVNLDITNGKILVKKDRNFVQTWARKADCYRIQELGSLVQANFILITRQKNGLFLSDKMH